MREWHFYDKVYRRWIVIFIGARKEMVKGLERDGFKEMDGIEDWINGAQGFHIQMDADNNDNGNRCHVIWMPKLDLGTLVHELGHMVMSIFETIGVIYGYNDQEVFTFYQEYWFNEITQTIKKYPKGRSYRLVKT